MDPRGYSLIAVILEILGRVQVFNLGSAQARAILSIILAFAETLMNHLEVIDGHDDEHLGKEAASAKRAQSIHNAQTLLARAAAKFPPGEGSPSSVDPSSLNS